MIEFTIEGDPVPQGRPRAGKIQRGKKRGKTVLYDPEKSRNYKEYVSIVAKQYAPKKPLEEPLHVHLKVYRPIPQSMSKKLREQALAGLHRPKTKPDNTNYAKGIEDALNGIIYKDDSQIVDLTVSKFYSDNPRVEVKIYELDMVN